jgi:hypothetical protein
MDYYPREQFTSENIAPQENFDPQDIVHDPSFGNPYGIRENIPFSVSPTNLYHRGSDSLSPVSVEDSYFSGLPPHIGHGIAIQSPERNRSRGANSDRPRSSPGVSAPDEPLYSPGQGNTTDTSNLSPGCDQPLEPYHLLGLSHAQTPMGRRMSDPMNTEFEYPILGEGLSPITISYPEDQEPYGRSTDDTNESLLTPNSRMHTSVPETDTGTGHEPNLNVGHMEINTPYLPGYDRQSVTERAMTREGYVNP